MVFPFGSRWISFEYHTTAAVSTSLLRIMSTPGDRTQELNMEGHKAVAPMVAQPRLEDKNVEHDPVVAPVVSGLSAICLEPGTADNPDMAPEVTPPSPSMAPEVAPPSPSIPTQEINRKVLMWTTAKPLFLLNMKEYREANERMIRDVENHDRDDEDYNEFHHQMFGDN
jgi:hypothetical protein